MTATDPAPGAEERLRADVAAHWPVLQPGRGRLPGAAHLHRRPSRGRRGRGLRAGERARARGRQARPLRGAGRGRPTRRRARLQLVGDAADRDRPRRRPAPGARAGRAPVQPAAPHPAGRGRARGADRRGRRRAGAWRSTPRSARSRSGCARRCRGTSPTGCRPRSGRRPTRWSNGAWPPWPTSTPRSPTAPGCGGRCSGRSSTSTSRAGPAGSRTSWSTSGRPPRRGGATWARSRSPRSSTPSSCRVWTTSWRASTRPSSSPAATPS